MRDADEILNSIGGFGRYQYLVVGWGGFGSVVTAMRAMVAFYITLDPEGKCDGPDCIESGPDAWCRSTTRAETILMHFDGCDPASWKGPLVGCSFFLGWFLGAIIFGRMTDLYGRYRTSLFLAIVACGILPILSLSTSLYMYYSLNVIHGMAIGGVSMISYISGMEGIPSKYQARSGVFILGIYATGCSSLSLVAYLVPEWRNFQYTVAIMGSPLLLFYLVVNESPRWLAANKRFAEARDVYAYIAKVNGTTYDPSLDMGDCVEGESAPVEELGFFDLFSFMEIRKRTLIAFYSWFVCSTTYYGLNYAAGDLGGNVYVNSLVISVVEVPCYFLQPFLVESEYFGRKRTCIYAFCLGAIACALFPFFDGIGLTIVGRVMSFVGKCGITTAFSLQYIWGAELFPTDLRVSAIGAADGLARGGALISPFAVKYIGVNWVLGIYAVLAILGAIVSTRLPETRGKEPPQLLEELRQEFECRENGEIQEPNGKRYAVESSADERKPFLKSL